MKRRIQSTFLYGIKFAGSLWRFCLSELQGYEWSWRKPTMSSIQGLGSLMDSFDNGSCAMYAFEKEIPKVSQTKLEGLKEYLRYRYK